MSSGKSYRSNSSRTSNQPLVLCLMSNSCTVGSTHVRMPSLLWCSIHSQGRQKEHSQRTCSHQIQVHREIAGLDIFQADYQQTQENDITGSLTKMPSYLGKCAYHKLHDWECGASCSPRDVLPHDFAAQATMTWYAWQWQCTEDRDKSHIQSSPPTQWQNSTKYWWTDL